MNFRSIHALRAVAAMMVVAFHAPLFLRPNVTYHVPTHAFGAAGVDIFFVISGFVMECTTSEHDRPWMEFLTRRLVRVLPMYWLATLAFVAVTLGAGAVPVDPSRVGKSLLFLPVYDREGYIRPFLAVGWTLYYELAFYLLVAACVGLRRRAAAHIAAATVVVVSLLAVAISAPALHSIRQLFWPLIIEFSFGVFLSWSVRRTNVLARSASLRGVVALVLITVGVMCIGTHAWWAVTYRRMLWWGIGSAMIVTGAVLMEPELQSTGWVARGFSRIADASYSLYLVHLMAFSAVWFLTPVAIRANVAFALTVLFVGPVLIALVVHRYVEAPLTRWLSKATVSSAPALR